MKKRVALWLGAALVIAITPLAHAVEILRWERLPLAVPLVVGQERIVFIDRNVRVGVPAHVGERLRIQSAGARCTCAPASPSSRHGCNCKTPTPAR